MNAKDLLDSICTDSFEDRERNRELTEGEEMSLPKNLVWEVAEHKDIPGQWHAEQVLEDGQIDVVIFTGPRAEWNARRWAAFQSDILHRDVRIGVLDAENAELRSRLQRAIDLVRNQRNELFDAALISQEEYEDLSAKHSSLARLESYDQLRARLEKAEAWRKELWLNHGHDMLYGDDGEMQCPRCCLDFKRDSLEHICGRIAPSEEKPEWRCT